VAGSPPTSSALLEVLVELSLSTADFLMEPELDCRNDGLDLPDGGLGLSDWLENECIAFMNSSVLCRSTSVFTLSTDRPPTLLSLSLLLGVTAAEICGNCLDCSGAPPVDIRILSKKEVLLTMMGSLSLWYVRAVSNSSTNLGRSFSMTGASPEHNVHKGEIILNV